MCVPCIETMTFELLMLFWSNWATGTSNTSSNTFITLKDYNIFVSCFCALSYISVRYSSFLDVSLIKFSNLIIKIILSFSIHSSRCGDCHLQGPGRCTSVISSLLVLLNIQRCRWVFGIEKPSTVDCAMRPLPHRTECGHTHLYSWARVPLKVTINIHCCRWV